MIPTVAPIFSAVPSEGRLRALCRNVLRADPERLDQSLFEIGLNSLSAASLAWLIEKDFMFASVSPTSSTIQRSEASQAR